MLPSSLGLRARAVAVVLTGAIVRTAILLVSTCSYVGWAAMIAIATPAPLDTATVVRYSVAIAISIFIVLVTSVGNRPLILIKISTYFGC